MKRRRGWAAPGRHQARQYGGVREENLILRLRGMALAGFDWRQLSGSYWNWRTSCGQRQATAIFAAHSSAASLDGSSRTV